jgi:hypothetical protein
MLVSYLEAGPSAAGEEIEEVNSAFVLLQGPSQASLHATRVHQS